MGPDEVDELSGGPGGPVGPGGSGSGGPVGRWVAGLVTAHRRAIVLGLRVTAGVVAAVVVVGGLRLLGTDLPESPRPDATAEAAARPAGEAVLDPLDPTESYELVVLADGAAWRLVQDSGVIRTGLLPERVDGLDTGRTVDGWTDGRSTVLVVSGPVPPLDDGSGAGAYAALLDRNVGLVVLGPAGRVLREPDGRTLWLVRETATGLQVIRRDLAALRAGVADQTWAALPAAGAVPVAATRAGLVLDLGGGRLAGWLPGSAPRPLGITGDVMSTGGTRLMVRTGCEERCRYVVVEVNTGRVIPQPPPVRPAAALGFPVLSRDGSRQAVVVDPDNSDGRATGALAVGEAGSAAEVVPGTDGERPPRPLGPSPTWSTSGIVFLPRPDLDVVLAYRPGDAGPRRVVADVRGVTRVWAR